MIRREHLAWNLHVAGLRYRFRESLQPVAAQAGPRWQPGVYSPRVAMHPERPVAGEARVALWWLPVGAGGHLVIHTSRWRERYRAWREHRDPRPLFHGAPETFTDPPDHDLRRHVIEMAPAWGRVAPSVVVVATGPACTRGRSGRPTAAQHPGGRQASRSPARQLLPRRRTTTGHPPTTSHRDGRFPTKLRFIVIHAI
ncbi:hypothetical protein [Dietzia lutea]|uniref:Uncharacterized protein n=1 Tax=Dietzia lutea TaxID=546160 RepID=A0A2S1RAS9_9ACTN|nr:hypothetical protein [Dietzia lutea]AWH93400.1 hypothetical protein A6035_15775 [Dietzia lutea]